MSEPGILCSSTFLVVTFSGFLYVGLMLSAKPWKPEAIVRLILSVMVCYFGGALIAAAEQYLAAGNKARTGVVALTAVGLAFLFGTLVLLRRRWEFQNQLKRMVWLLCLFYAGLACCAWVSKLAGASSPTLGQMLVSLLSLQGAGLILIALFLREHGLTWIEGFGLLTDWRKSMLLGIMLCCLYLPIALMLQWFSAEKLLPLLHLKPHMQQVVVTLQEAHPGLRKAMFGLLSVLVVPPAEEGFFRGILYPAIKQAGFPRLALWGTAILFGVVHNNLPSFLPLTLLAVGLTLLYERTGNLLSSIVAHALFNAVNFARLLLLENEGAASIAAFMGFVLLLGLPLAVAALKPLVARK